MAASASRVKPGGVLAALLLLLVWLLLDWLLLLVLLSWLLEG
jgi:hypothetical protein